MAYLGIGNYVMTGEPISEGLGGTCGLLHPFNRAKREACRVRQGAKKEERVARRAGRREDMMSLLPPKGEIPWLPIFGGAAALIVGVWWWRSRRKAA